MPRWIIFAFLSAGFAAIIPILSKLGLQGIDSTLATGLRAWVMALSLTLLLALLTTGTLSDHLGRRPVLVGALAAEAASMVLLASADGAGALIAARALQGAATGAATSAAGAALLDLEDPRRPGRPALTNSIAPVAGMAAGVLASTLLIRFAPAPTVTVYFMLAALFTAQAVAVTFTTETARPHPGAERHGRAHARSADPDADPRR